MEWADEGTVLRVWRLGRDDAAGHGSVQERFFELEAADEDVCVGGCDRAGDFVAGDLVGAWHAWKGHFDLVQTRSGCRCRMAWGGLRERLGMPR